MLLLAMLIFTSMFVFSYARLHKTVKECCSDAEKCDQQRNPTESIIWEAFSHNLLSCR